MNIERDSSPHRIFHLNDGGLSADIAVPENEYWHVHNPVLRSIVNGYSENPDKRFIVFLVGPPGGGKTTIAGIWDQMLQDQFPKTPHQILPMDGFLFPLKTLQNRYAWSIRDDTLVTLDTAKCNPDAFDPDGLYQKLNYLKNGEFLLWPKYDRILHDPIPDAIKVLPSGIIIVEGAYLFLKNHPWDKLEQFADYKVWVATDEPHCRKRIIERSIRTGSRPQQAAFKYDFFNIYIWCLCNY